MSADVERSGLMFGHPRKSARAISKANVPTETTGSPKYPKPKILLIDMDDRCATALQAAGYNVCVGTFGTPYRVKPSKSLYYVSLSSSHLPNHEEQEIVVVNLLGPDPTDAPPGNVPGDTVKAFWQSCSDGLIDPRPITMFLVRSAFDKILYHGGIFIVFAAPQNTTTYYSGNSYEVKYSPEEMKCSNWGFLSEMAYLNVTDHYGHEITFESQPRELTLLFSRAQEGARYYCTVSPSYHLRGCWMPLAKNKYGEDVAGILSYKDPKGYIVILPQMPTAHQFIVQLLEEWCTQWKPALFPYFEGSRWIHRPEYEIPKVVELENEIDRIRAEADKRVVSLLAEIERIRQENPDWYTLLQGSGNELVQAVIRSLKRLGFQKVVDVDAEAGHEGKKGELREDIQVHDRSPVLIIDVKGVQGRPDDDESRQAEKHAIMRMREWNRTDVQPLTIINHQRHLPPHDRDQKAYRDEIIENAKQTRLGLMTTWDLFRILKNADMLGWPPTVVQPIFYRVRLIEPVPEHCKAVGKVVKAWRHAFGTAPTVSISVGDRLAVEVGDTFLESNIESLQVDDQTVQTAPAGSRCGLRLCNCSANLREGARVFLIVNVAPGPEESTETVATAK